MDITPHIDSLRQDLTAAAEAAAPEAREAIQRLLFALGPAVRLAIMDAGSQAAAEITAKMPAGTVNVLLEGRDLAFVVQTAAPAPEAAAAAPPVDSTEEDGGLARISLRIPEAVKARAEEMAARSGQSLNNWLVNVVRARTEAGGAPGDPSPSGDPFGGKRGGRRMTGWI